MPQTVEVRFKGIRRDFFLWSDEQDPLRLKEAVIVECERGHDLGHVHTAGEAALKKCGGACSGCEVGTQEKAPVVAEGSIDEPEQVADESSVPPEPQLTAEAPEAPTTKIAPPKLLRPVLRRASSDEIRTAADLRRAEEDARRQASEKVRQHKLEMKMSDAEWQWDRTKLTLFFTAEKRVDFRALVRDLASVFRTRIELRQIGVRDEAARLGGVGRCGREYCCSTWLTELSPVNLALAKDQHLSLNPAQISGGCGRLLCCLKYEHEFYVAARKRFPREGKAIATARGFEKVIAVDIFRERVFLRNEEGSRIIPLLDLRQEMEAAAAQGIVVPQPGPPRRDAGAPRRPGPPTDRPLATERRDQGRPRPPAPPPEPRAQAAPVEPPSPPSTEAPPGEPGRRPRRRRRGRRGGRGNQGGPSSSAPGTPEA